MPVVLWSVNDWDSQSPEAGQEGVRDALEKVYQATTIYTRFDALADLIQQCETAALASNDTSAIETLNEQATQFASAIVDAKSPLNLKEKIAARQEFSKIDPEFMPWMTPHSRNDRTNIESTGEFRWNLLKHQLKSHLKKGSDINPTDAVGDIADNVTYLKTMAEREPYRIFVADGKFKKIELSPDEENLTLNNFDTKEYSAHEHENNALFVVSHKGDFFSGSTIIHEFHHSSFMAAANLPMGGTMVVTNGNLQQLTDNSGHYMPPTSAMVKFMALLRKAGVLDDKPASEIWNDKFLRFEIVSNKPEYELQSDGGRAVPPSNPLFKKDGEMNFFQAVYEGHVAEVKKLMATGVDLNKRDDDGRTPLALAALAGQQEIFAEILAKSSPEDLNQQDRFGMTPLLLAIGKGHTEIAIGLIHSGANVNQPNSDYLAPLTLAVNSGDATIINALLTNHADSSNDAHRLNNIIIQKNNIEVIDALTQAGSSFDFSPMVEASANYGEFQPLINVLSRLSSDYGAFDDSAKNTVESEAGNIASNYITYIEDLPADERQKSVDLVLSQQNMLGKIFHENSLIDSVKSKLERNGFAALVQNFKEPQIASASPKHLSGTASVFAALQQSDPGITSPKEIRSAPDYTAPSIAAISKEKKSDNIIEQTVQISPVSVKR